MGYTLSLCLSPILMDYMKSMQKRKGDLENCDGVSREVPCSALKGETVPDSLPAPRDDA